MLPVSVILKYFAFLNQYNWLTWYNWNIVGTYIIHNLYGEQQVTQWPKEKGQKDKQRSTKHTYKTEDRVRRTPLKTGGDLRCSGRVSSSCSLVPNPYKLWIMDVPTIFQLYHVSQLYWLRKTKYFKITDTGNITDSNFPFWYLQTLLIQTLNMNQTLLIFYNLTIRKYGIPVWSSLWEHYC
jgi:hypothetical protein